MPLTIQDIQTANRKAGHQFFTQKTMKFWRSQIFPEVYEGPGGVYFVDSIAVGMTETGEEDRIFKIRHFDRETADIMTVAGGPGRDRLAESEAKTFANDFANRSMPALNR